MVGRGNFRGDLNAVLNRLVREGVIAADLTGSFWTGLTERINLD